MQQSFIVPVKTTQKSGVLYQEHPFYKSGHPNLHSFTESLESYQRGARWESWALEHCHRNPTVHIVLRFHVFHDVTAIRENWRRLRIKLSRIGIPFAAVLELSMDGGGYLNDLVHYHFVFETSLDKDAMELKMQEACLKSKQGICGKDFSLCSYTISVWGLGMIHYFTKFGKKYEHEGKVRLFKKGLGLQKFRYSHGWFLEKDRTPTTKTKILERLRTAYKRKIAEMQPSADASPFTP